MLNLSFLDESFLIFFNMHDNFSSSLEAVIIRLSNSECASTVTGPFVGRLSLLSGDNFNKIRNDERGIESDSELTDDVFSKLTITFF